MVAQQEYLGPVRPLLARIEAEYRPREVWLFGSRARGAAGPESDWDLLVVLPDETDASALDPLRAWRIQKASGVTADVLLCTHSDFEADRDTVNTIGYVVAREGVRVFERSTADRQ
jgi:predicted nucleotidyltransferase